MKLLAILLSIVLIPFAWYSAELRSTDLKDADTAYNVHAAQPIELGKVAWIRNIEEGIKMSSSSDKPILLLFQEVPGCSTCQQFGAGVLSHPLIVEAIESEFIPVAIYNNKGGEDAKALKYFGEPAWNNPVVRIVDKNKKDIVKRTAGNYSKLGIVSAMKSALQKSQKPIPEYLNILEREFIARQNGLEEATVSMYCFWTGEKKLAGLPGVIETQPGFMDGKEVVQLMYNPSEVNYQEVLKFANAKGCADHVFTTTSNEKKVAEDIVGNATSSKTNFKMDGEPKYYLSKTDYRFIPMTALQAALVNAEIGKQSNPEYLLSPRQLNVLKEKNRKKSLINVPIEKGWHWN